MNARVTRLTELSDETRRQFESIPLRTNDRIVVGVSDDGKDLLVAIKSLRQLVDEHRHEETDYRGSKFETWGSPSWDAKGWFERVPECRVVKVQHSTDRRRMDDRKVAATDYSALLIRELWPEDRIVYRSQHAHVLVDYLYMRFMSQAGIAESVAKFKLNGEVPPIPEKFAPYWQEHPSAKLRLSDYQRAACSLMLGLEGYALFMDPGTGKTPVAIQRVCVEGAKIRRDHGRPMRVLIVCPPQVRLQWQTEFRRFSTAAGKVVIVRGGQIKRVKLLTEAIRDEGEIAYGAAVIGYDSLVESAEVFAKVPWDLIVCDESHKFKSSSTNRWKAMIALRDAESSARLILTGTPIGNSLIDLWAQLEFLGVGLSGFSTLQGFRSFHGRWEEVEGVHGVEKLVGIKNIPMLQERLSRVSFQITKVEAGLKLPDKVPQIIEVQMTAAQAKWYKELADKLLLEIEDQLESSSTPTQVTVENILTKLLRLAQVTSGFITTDAVFDDAGNVVKPKKILQVPGVNPKLDQLMELLEDEGNDPNAKTVVWACFREDIHRIDERLTKAGIGHALYYGSTPQAERDAIVHAFNHDPAMRVLVCNAQTAGEGLNLLGYDPDVPDMQTYCDRAIFFSQNWSSILRAQAEERVHRRGTRMPVQIVDIMVPGSIDQEIRDRVTNLRSMASSITDVRDVLRSVLGAVSELNGSLA